ncbi:MAG TPA: hypothetical protein VHA09_09100 [Nitrososphaera sp.]|nr:hypothetical protein [Nitrososphaera sp.]
MPLLPALFILYASFGEMGIDSTDVATTAPHPGQLSKAWATVSSAEAHQRHELQMSKLARA